MEFSEKLQELRKSRGLTQEELAASVFVSRAAVSKWESGRGYPGIDSLKALSGFFGVTIDHLLSGDVLPVSAGEDKQEKENPVRGRLFALLDCSALLLFLLPFFGCREGNFIRAANLLSLSGIAPWLKLAYCLIVAGIAVCGVLALALQNSRENFFKCSQEKISLGLNAAGTAVFIVSRQPYAAVFLFLCLLVKLCMPVRRR